MPSIFKTNRFPFSYLEASHHSLYFIACRSTMLLLFVPLFFSFWTCQKSKKVRNHRIAVSKASWSSSIFCLSSNRKSLQKHMSRTTNCVTHKADIFPIQQKCFTKLFNSNKIYLELSFWFGFHIFNATYCHYKPCYRFSIECHIQSYAQSIRKEWGVVLGT